jgi:hypothetical protein
MGIAQANLNILVVGSQSIEPFESLDGGRPVPLPVVEGYGVEVGKIHLILSFPVSGIDPKHGLKVLDAVAHSALRDCVYAKLIVRSGQHGFDIVALILRIDAYELFQNLHAFDQVAGFIVSDGLFVK